jgi:hypothetical protein
LFFHHPSSLFLSFTHDTIWQIRYISCNMVEHPSLGVKEKVSPEVLSATFCTFYSSSLYSMV